MKVKYHVRFLQEAVEFLENLDPKTREKIYYNIRKAQVAVDNEVK